jgi:hypothetical protein
MTITMKIVGWQETQIASVGVAPARILKIVAIAVVSSIFARLARKVHLHRTLIGRTELCPARAPHRRLTKSNLIFGQIGPKSVKIMTIFQLEITGKMKTVTYP